MTLIRQTVFYLLIFLNLFLSYFVCTGFCELLGGSTTATLIIQDASAGEMDGFITNAAVSINDISKNDYTVIYHPIIEGLFNLGVYLIYRLADGTYTISVSTPGYVTQTRTIDIKMVETHGFMLTPGESIQKFLLSVEGIKNGNIRSEIPGIDCGGDCYELFDENTAVRLFAVPDDGYRFDGWYGACAGNNECSISIIQDEAVSAYFRKDNGVLIQPENIDFDNVFPGDLSSPKAITITNISNSPLIFNQINLTANHSSDFAILNNTCQDNAIQPMNSCVVETQFSPSSVGPQNTYIDVDTTHSKIQIPLTGYGFQTIFSYERIWPVQHNLHYFDKLTAITVDPVKDHIYLVDSKKNQVLKYTSGGRYITSWGKYGKNEGEFDYPIGIAASRDGYVYVVDGKNYRIQKFSNFGKFITSWGNLGASDGEFNWHPEKHAGIAIDSEGFVYIADNINDKVQKFSDSGDFIFSFTSPKGLMTSQLIQKIIFMFLA